MHKSLTGILFLNILIFNFHDGLLAQSNPTKRIIEESYTERSSRSGSQNLLRSMNAPLLGDYRVGLGSFNKISGTNLRYEKQTRTITKDVEVKFSEANHSNISRSKANSYTDYSAVLGFVPQVTTKKEITEHYYVLTDNGKIYDGPLRSDYPDEVFATLTEAIANLNNRGVSGNVRFLLTDTVFTETGTMNILITGSDTTNAAQTLTIKPDTNVTSVKITTNSNSPVFIINESYIIFDGSKSENGITRNMTIINSGAASSSGCAAVSGISNVVFKNLIFSASASSIAYNLLFDNSNNSLIENCELKKAATGIQFQSNCSNFIVRTNDIGSSITQDKIQNTGIAIISSSNFDVENNRIIGLERPYSGTVGTFGSVIGISIGNQAGGIDPVAGSINGNIIRDIKHTGVDLYAYSALGIKLSGRSLNSNITIANNFITDILGDGDAGIFFNPHGIFVDQGGGYKIYYNSVVMMGTVNNTGQIGAAYTGAISFYPGTIAPTNLDVRNNIFINYQTIAYTGSKAYAIYSGIASSAFTEINFNDYYTSGVNGMLGFLGSDRTNISAWQTATGRDVNSISKLVNFASAIDLHLSSSSIGDKDLQGTPVSILKDIDSENRNPAYPYIGADEVINSPLALKLNLTVILEGFYDGSTMVNDTVTVYLANTFSPFLKVDSAKVELNSGGFGISYFPRALENSYYIVVMHRNSIETWSIAGQPFNFSNGTIYDFTSGQNQAYGNNLKLKYGKYCVYSGDVNQDGIVNLLDLIDIDNDSYNFATGYLNTDLTGDYVVDLNDLIICDNNSYNFTAKVTPENLQKYEKK